MKYGGKLESLQALRSATGEIIYSAQSGQAESLGTAFVVPVTNDGTPAFFVATAHHCIAEMVALDSLHLVSVRFAQTTHRVEEIAAASSYLDGDDVAILRLSGARPAAPLRCGALPSKTPLPFVTRGCASGMRTQYSTFWGTIGGVEELKHLQGVAVLELSGEAIPIDLIRGLSGAPVCGLLEDRGRLTPVVVGLVREVTSAAVVSGRFYGCPVQALLRACEDAGLTLELAPMRGVSVSRWASTGARREQGALGALQLRLQARWREASSPVLPRGVALPAVAVHLLLRQFDESSADALEGYRRDTLPRSLERRLTLHEVLTESTWTRALVLGDPGSGKSTLLAMEAAQIATQRLQDTRNRAAIVLSLAEFEAAIRQDPDHSLAHAVGAIGRRLGIRGLRGAVERELSRGKMVLLLDGLDEVSSQNRGDILERILAVADSHAANRVVIMSRKTGLRPLPGFTVLEVAPLQIEEQRELLRHLCSPDECATLMRTIVGSATLRDLAAVPLTLSLLALVARETSGGLQSVLRQRSRLLHLALRLLLEGRHRSQGGVRNPETAESLLASVSLTLTESPGAEEVSDTVPIETLERLLLSVDTQGALQAGWGGPGAFVRDVAHGSGVIFEVDALGRLYRYLHRSMREFLCALAIARLTDGSARARFIEDHLHAAKWAEVLILYAGLAELPAEHLRRLLDGPPDLALRALTELEDVEPELASRILQLDASASLRDRRSVFGRLEARLRSPDELIRVLEQFVRTAGSGIARADLYFVDLLARQAPSPAATRLRDGLLRALPTPPMDLRADLDIPGATASYWCSVLEGRFPFGAAEDDPLRPDWVPVLTDVDTEAFEIGKTPVTNRLYLLFDPEHTAPRETYETVAASELDRHPVVNVSWYEASVFCWWLRQSHADVRLPTEREWEKAASWDGRHKRRFPWGDEWEPDRLNNWEAGPGRTTAVGQYPQGQAPCGALDMAGNVWEWCEDWFVEGDLLMETLRGLAALPPPSLGEGRRVDRGGGWYFDVGRPATFLRAADDPADRFRHCGFRMARTPPVDG